jgi:hypothetical protein
MQWWLPLTSSVCWRMAQRHSLAATSTKEGHFNEHLRADKSAEQDELVDLGHIQGEAAWDHFGTAVSTCGCASGFGV